MKKYISLITICSLATSAFALDVIAHRGENHQAPQNSIEGAKIAWDCGVQWVEADFTQMKDGSLVCMHCDHSLQSLASTDKKISDLTQEDLKTLNLASTKKWQEKGYKFIKIPTLDEFLIAMPRDKGLVFEAKGFSSTYADEVEKAFIRTNTILKNVIFISFSREACVGLKKKFPKNMVLFLFGGKEIKNGPEWAIEQCKKLGVDGIDIGVGQNPKNITKEYVDAVKAAGYPVYVWTVNKKEMFKHCMDIGVDGITTDHAGEFQGAYKGLMK